MISSKTYRNILNFVMFELGWFACVLLSQAWALIIVAVFLLVHFVLVSQYKMDELKFIVIGTLAGSLLDGLWLRTGILADTSGAAITTPLWLVALWAIFMTSLNHSLKWLGSNRVLMLLVVPIAGPFAYWSASALGAVTLPNLLPSLLALAVGWLVLFPALLSLRDFLYPRLAR
ncbi:DUF2878 domain-containing protein [Marinobacter psychrophilus]|jgi:hypothetical protein|uniref:DUF2878 domain-containing protein n=1 Tax=Marinobacter psychrophilus TaxID=330734 RepID=UPI001B4AAF32|nr:DUF2878 domain-containing protein [Marinobacter psychrophilus]MBQ0763939.1 DUF2878 domain-containing protein [Marinobacter psychrophilus]MBQ0845973.1 DUF2878 domain-containing protein [Marinobacter psychrophilus]